MHVARNEVEYQNGDRGCGDPATQGVRLGEGFDAISAPSTLRWRQASTRRRCSSGWPAINVSVRTGASSCVRQLATTDADGRTETVTADDLFYWPPGHNVKVDADAEIVMFSPQHEHTAVIDHMIAKTRG